MPALRVDKTHLIKYVVLPLGLFVANWAFAWLGVVGEVSSKPLFTIAGDPFHGNLKAYLGGAALTAAGAALAGRAPRLGGVAMTLGLALFLRSAPALALGAGYLIVEALRALVLISRDEEPSLVKRWEINLGRLSLIVVFAFGGFIIAEITLPGLAPSAWERGVFVIPQSEVRYPKPYVMFGGEPNAAGLNRLGYPGPAPAEEKPAGEFRIFILGGSTVFNHPGSIASALQDAYHRNGDDHVRVFNFGVVSSVSGMDLARIVYEVADHQPDLIIMYNGGNDLLNNWGREDRPGYPFDFVYTENNPLLYLSDPTAAERDRYQGWTLFLLESRLLRRLLKDDLEEALIKRKLRPNDLGAPGSPQWQQALAATYIKHLALGHRVAKGLEARFLGVFQPILFFKTPHVGRERQINAYLENTDWGRQRKRGAHEMRAMITEGMRRLRDTEGMDLLDLSALFSKRRDAVFTDQIHITETARAAVGKAIFEHLERAGIGAGNP